MPIVVSSGCRLKVVVEGPDDGVPVLFSHHLGGRLQTFDAQVLALAGRRIIRFDTRGHGASDAPEEPYSVATLGADALTILDQLGIECTDFVGISQGGMTGMWLASEHPQRIRKLVLANTTPFIPNKSMWDELAAKSHAEGMAEVARTTIEGWLTPRFRAEHPDTVDMLVRQMAEMKVDGFIGNTSVLRDVDLRASLANITAPTLVIGGAQDGPRGASVPVITEGVQNGRSVLIQSAAHLTHVENPQEFNSAMIEHLGSAPR